MLVAFLVGGCIAEHPTGRIPDATGGCQYTPAAQQGSAEFGAGAHYIKTPTGGASWSGRHINFRWHDDPVRLVSMTITLEWDQSLGQERTLRTGLRNLEARSVDEYWSFGPYNGPSPLVMAFTGEDADAIGDGIVVDVGTTTEGPSSVALVDHEVLVTVQETYLCEGGVPPQGRMSR